MRWACGGDSDGVPPSQTSEMLGTQDAQHTSAGEKVRLRPGEVGCASHLSSRRDTGGTDAVPGVSHEVDQGISGNGETARERPARATVVHELPQATVEAAPDERD